MNLMKTLVEVGDCFSSPRLKEDEIRCYKVLVLCGETFCYVETIRTRKDVKSESQGYHDNKQLEFFDAEISMDMHERTFAQDKQTITNHEYETCKKIVLQTLGLQNPDNPLFKNILAAQNAAEAERLIKLAIEAEKNSFP